MLKRITPMLALLPAASALAGGPLLLEGPNGHIPATYQSPDIVFNIETGQLGSRTNDNADQLVRDAFTIWNTIDTSTINITQGDDVGDDIDVNNFTIYIPSPFNNTIHNDDDGLNPIVYDNDGSIIDAFFGDGQGTGPDASVVGFAASSIIIGSSFFTEGFAVINGNDSLPINDEELRLIVAHEIGHYLGLDHSQADISNTELFFVNSCKTAVLEKYPLMYPYACRAVRATHIDDEVALSTLYPAAGFYQAQGQLTGTFITENGEAVRGANLWLENILTGDVISIVSDYLEQCTGFFALMLPPGSYTLHANSVNVEFYEGSSVGPYADSPVDLSFQPPASTLGSDLAFNAGGALPAFINVEAGKSVEVVFRTDGSGSMTSSDTQLDLTQIYNSADSCVVTSGGGGGSPSMPLLLALSIIPALRVWTVKTTADRLSGC